MEEEEFTRKVVAAIKAVPKGKVSTYGTIAKQAGNPRAAQEVAAILDSQSSTYGLPWQRIINAQGEIAIKQPELAHKQRVLLEQEGVEFMNDKVDLNKYLHNPQQASLNTFF